MTSSVKIQAHCGADKEVVVLLKSVMHVEWPNTVVCVLQDGESHETYICDDREIATFERLKVSPTE